MCYAWMNIVDLQSTRLIEHRNRAKIFWKVSANITLQLFVHFCQASAENLDECRFGCGDKRRFHRDLHGESGGIGTGLDYLHKTEHPCRLGLEYVAVPGIAGCQQRKQ